ncbi:MAG TPA: inner membrane-spanning protein YciB [Steroidobacteraceae bacterium]|jgi:intracellular septation protein|nr:inner membrane-spanning protein YciB [Steroidobacteraceae bacterium]
MQTLLEYVPWIVFGAVYYLGGGLYPATAALMVAMTLLLAYFWIRARKVPQVSLALTILVLVFGSATLILHDVRFLQWKASVIYWLLGLVLAGSVWVGSKTLLERALGAALPEDVTVAPSSWRNASLMTGVFYLLLGFANIWVALNRSEAEWVKFKLWISMPVAIVFLFGVILYLLRGAFAKEPS